MDKYAMRVPFSNSHYQSDEDEDDDDRSCDFNFHPYQSLGPSQSSPLKNSGLMSDVDSVKFTHGKSGILYDGALISEIERNMKELSDNLLHGMEGISTRLSQLESRTQKIENAVDDLKCSAVYNYGKTDGKLRHLENILLEVKDGVHFLREKQEIAETKIQLAKLRASSKSSSSQSKDQRNAPQIDSVQQAPPSAPQQPHPPLPLPVTFPLTASSTSPYQNLPPVGSIVEAQLPSSLSPHSQIPLQLPVSFYSPEGQSPEIPAQQYHYSQPPPHQFYPVSPQLSQLIPQSSPSGAVTPQNSLFHPEETTPYFPSYSYPPSIPQPFSQPAGSRPTQEFHPGQFFRSTKSDESTTGSAYASSLIDHWHLSQIPSGTGVETSYSQLPKAQILPRALPTTQSVNDGLDYEGTGNRVPLDDVVEKVTSMGFRRDLVRATARKLAENGQSVDLNVVLDKLMNGGPA